MDGIINVYKEKGFTSHDVVAKLRKITGIKKIGHTGTLDPDAVGALPVCIGKATKLCGYLTDKDKEYIAKVKLGIVTDTLDITGKIIKEEKYTGGKQDILEAVKRFTGDIMQTPPMYSAVKVNGRKLYEFARNNIEIEREKRAVHIYSLDVIDTDMEAGEFTLKAHVSKGTYIRSLCNDIGRALGCGACMSELIRTRSGVFNAENSYTLKQIKDIVTNGGLLALSKHMINVEEVFDNEQVIMDDIYDLRVKNGNDIFSYMFKPYFKEGKITPFIKLDNAVSVFLSDGTFKAVYKKNDIVGSGEEPGYSVLKMF